MTELDGETAGSLPMMEGDIDLTPLTACMSSHNHVQEQDRLWDFSGILGEVSQALQAEEDRKAKKEEAAEPAPEPAPQAKKSTATEGRRS